MKNPLPGYPGSKGGAGVFQSIINLIPAHNVFVELFAGSAGIFQKIKAPPVVILNDIDKAVYDAIMQSIYEVPGVVAFNHSYEALLPALKLLPGVFIYADPPYMLSTRSGGRRYYNYEWDDNQHSDFVEAVRGIGCMTMISHYRSDLYDSLLDSGWNRTDFKAMTRGGVRDESVYYNYFPPSVLQDYSYAGMNFTERQRIKRKAARLVDKLSKLPDLEKQLLITEIVNCL